VSVPARLYKDRLSLLLAPRPPIAGNQFRGLRVGEILKAVHLSLGNEDEISGFDHGFLLCVLRSENEAHPSFQDIHAGIACHMIMTLVPGSRRDDRHLHGHLRVLHGRTVDAVGSPQVPGPYLMSGVNVSRLMILPICFPRFLPKKAVYVEGALS